MSDQTYTLTITATGITSTDPTFSIHDIGQGNNFSPVDAYFITHDSSETPVKVARERNPHENRISNQTLPRLAFQVFEQQIDELSPEERANFPVCQYGENKPITGIYINKLDLARALGKKDNYLEFLQYKHGTDVKYVIYGWNVFSTLLFVQECLKRFGKPGDEFILIYRPKNPEDSSSPEINNINQQDSDEKVRRYAELLKMSRNVVFHGAPGTGKTYLAKQIASEIVSDGARTYDQLTEKEQRRIGFVQFHQGYDYTDFVEGLRPTIGENGSVGFELRDGIFKRFVADARRNAEDSSKNPEVLHQEMSAAQKLNDFLEDDGLLTTEFTTKSGSRFHIVGVDDQFIHVHIPNNEIISTVSIRLDELRHLVAADRQFKQVKDILEYLGAQSPRQHYSYEFALLPEIAKRTPSAAPTLSNAHKHNYVFIIDEINRGQISRIFGELFFSIDPEYRGKVGTVATQFTNLHADSDKADFYIPDNVYIIGTMNDIDRSVDTFDFAMRRRFRFIKLGADANIEMLSVLGDQKMMDAERRMHALNTEIAKTEDLGENYQIGAAYFKKLEALTPDELWSDYLEPLLEDYVQGMPDSEETLDRFHAAYDQIESDLTDSTEVTTNPQPSGLNPVEDESA